MKHRGKTNSAAKREEEKRKLGMIKIEEKLFSHISYHVYERDANSIFERRSSLI